MREAFRSGATRRAHAASENENTVMSQRDAFERILAALLGSTRSGVIQLDRRGRIVAANDPARDLLRRGDGLSDQSGSLHARAPAEDAALQALLVRALPRCGGQGAGGSMLVRRGLGRPPLVLHVSPVGEGGCGDRHGPRCGVRAGGRPGKPDADRSGAGSGGPRPHADGEPRGGVASRGQDRTRHRERDVAARKTRSAGT